MNEAEENNVTGNLLVKIGVVFYTVLTLIAILIIYLRRDSVPLNSYFKGNILHHLLLGIACAIGFIFLWVIAKTMFSWVKNAEKTLKQIIGDLSPTGIIYLAIFSGIGEEMLFRGALQPSWGIEITSILFGIAHFPPVKELRFYPFLATAMGFVLGWLFIYTGSLIAPITTHVMINMINLYRINKVSLCTNF